MPGPDATFAELAVVLADIGRHCYARGWALGTSGNFSAVLSRDPLRLAITASSVDKGLLTPAHIVLIDAASKVVQGSGSPSAEASLHVTIVRAREAGAVLHTHSIWSTMLSDAGPAEAGIGIAGYEMLKGLEGVRTHEHREWLPILENAQDWAAQAPLVEQMLRQRTDAHGFLIRSHGLYTWGRDLAEANRQLEILEFLLEVTARKRGMSWQP
jgi:methylthioribulose-1-phosphate dehydratase